MCFRYRSLMLTAALSAMQLNLAAASTTQSETYMLMGEARKRQGATPAKDPSQVKEWFYVGPHIMVVLPDSAKDALRGINQNLSNNQPYISLLGSGAVATPIWVIPVANGGDRIKEEPAK